MAAPIALAITAAMQTAQHVCLMRLPMLWYHVGATLLNAAVVSVTVALYLRWRGAAVLAADSLRRLSASEALRNDLTHMLVHDLKNPLTATYMSSSMLLATGAELTERRRELLTIAVDSQQRLATMIGDILDVARAEEGSMPVGLEPRDLRETMQAAVDDARLPAGAAGLALSVADGGRVWAMFDGDKTRRVVANLLGNAIQFTPRGGAIVVSARAEGELAVATVRDTGRGVPAGARGLVFDKFAQVEAGARGRRMSVGLGLAFCKLAVEAQGGRIWVDDAEGGGSAFSFTLPLAPDGPAEASGD